MQTPARLVDHYFRHEYGRLVATLTRALGAQHLDLVEDVVQSALLQALQSWSLRGVPQDPSGWLYRVARNAALDALRRDHRWESLRRQLPFTQAESAIPEPVHFESEVNDDQLRMLFLCCREELPVESQVALALKTLCGLDVHEIARALLTTDANIAKRISRAKDKLRELDDLAADLASETVRERLPAVQTVIYLLFNEGYHSSLPDRVLRRDLCEDAIRLGRLLIGHPITGVASSDALLALMLYHAARFDARCDAAGGVLLLEEQDRSKWDTEMLAEGWRLMIASGRGEELSRYHVEAAIVAESCLVASFQETNWRRIIELYDLLMRLAPNPIHALNRAVAVAQAENPETGLRELAQFPAEPAVEQYYLWHAVVGELQRQAGQFELAKQSLAVALRLCLSEAEKNLLRKRLALCEC
jgi:RNA polymerase sigma-70 factor (ECF subfamily)